MALNSGSDMEHDATLAAAYRAAAGEQPPAHLDAAIRAAARREAGAGPQLMSRLRAWRVPVSLAAVVVLSVTVVLMVREEGGDRLEPAASRVAPAPAVEQPVAQTAPRPAAPAMPPLQQRRAEPSASGAPAAPAPQPMAKAAPEVEQQVLAGAASASAREDVAASPRLEAAPQAESPRPMMRSAPATMAADALSAPAARKAAPAAAMSAPVPAQQALWQDLLTEPAEKWVQRIVEWRRAGRTADADALAAEFRRRFPDQRLPDEGR